MLKAKEKYYMKKIKLTNYKTVPNSYGIQNRKRMTFWLLWVIPIFIIDVVVDGEYERGWIK